MKIDFSYTECQWLLGTLQKSLTHNRSVLEKQPNNITDLHIKNLEGLRDKINVAMLKDKISPKQADILYLLPSYCFAISPQNPCKIIVINRFEWGCALVRELSSDELALGVVNERNSALGVTPAQREAMLAGSTLGWHTPAADPRNYHKDGTPRDRPNEKKRNVNEPQHDR